MRFIGRSRIVALLLGASVAGGALVLFFGTAAPARGQALPLLTRHVRPAVANGHAALVARLAAAQTLRLSIALPLRNEAELDELLPRPNYTKDFHPITSGSNGFPAMKGYNLCDGWGSPNGANLINAIAP